MTCKELIEYLSRFSPDELVAVVVVDTEKRLYHKICGCQLMDEPPALMFETTETGSLDEIAEEEGDDEIL